MANEEQLTEEQGVVSAPELDEQDERPNRVILNKRKQLAIRADQVKEFARKNSIEFIAFYDGVSGPMDISANCSKKLIRTVMGHLMHLFPDDHNLIAKLLQDAWDEANKKFEENNQQNDQVNDRQGEGNSGPEGQPDGDDGVLQAQGDQLPDVL